MSEREGGWLLTDLEHELLGVGDAQAGHVGLHRRRVPAEVIEGVVAQRRGGPDRRELGAAGLVDHHDRHLGCTLGVAGARRVPARKSSTAPPPQGTSTPLSLSLSLSLASNVGHSQSAAPGFGGYLVVGGCAVCGAGVWHPAMYLKESEIDSR
eukprot:COSAG01_NODE_2985_length_6752_cov_133.017736_10_plen_153_part_00